MSHAAAIPTHHTHHGTANALAPATKPLLDCCAQLGGGLAGVAGAHLHLEHCLVTRCGISTSPEVDSNPDTGYGTLAALGGGISISTRCSLTMIGTVISHCFNVRSDNVVGGQTVRTRLCFRLQWDCALMSGS